MTYRTTAFTNGYEFARGSGYALPEYPFVMPQEIADGSGLGRHQIVIVGAGLTGLTLAALLAQYGVSCVVLDEDSSVGVKGASSRGICYTQKSLEIFERLGIFGRIAGKGIQWSVGRTFAGRDEVYSFDLRQQGSFNLSVQPPFINIQQFYIEGYLVERLHALGNVDLRWKSRVVAFEQTPERGVLTVETPAGNYRIDAEHIIDASGSSTPFHAWTGALPTTRRGDDRWCIADVRFKRNPPTERHTWIEAPFNDNRAVWQHKMGDEVWRIDYQMAPGSDPAEVSREDTVRARLARQFGADAEIELVWVGPYAYRSVCVPHMRAGRVFFSGDTAKVVSPFGARGGNSGVSDADNLAWKLAAVAKGQAHVSLLDTYHDERHEAARQNVMVTNRTARFLRPAEGFEQRLRKATLALARRHAFARQLVNTGRMAVANTYTQSPACGKGGGLSVQNVALAWADGSPGCLNDLLRWAAGRLLLLVFGDMSGEQARRVRELTASAPLVAVQVLAPGVRARCVEHVRDGTGHLQGACRVFGHAWALVRPDAYLADTGETVDAQLVGAVERALGLH